ncbi:glycosyltransferase family 2 protein [Rhabdobacter roseus]|uniref:Cellulose synthase/poly-beta-1,6-N-acetylglucosamine synthase-like glycosyltransferase n=1 Tax=Rhabdobacter roseus TaxID=1655419 RepID=A0A840U5G5_9BACT|nr:glycosyltransferase [Rhabdobacter roseus]MBB5287320.1 cellulose synthase/poly-beta-1,6-N-acetylglucosamine synthase-like glycosyltransferase [Rhabdobacter roseus]
MQFLFFIAYLLFGATAIFAGYLLLFAVAGLFRHKAPYLPGKHTRLRRMVVFLPSYREDSVILESAARALEQSYPATHYDVVVIADSLQPATLEKLRKLPIRVVEVVFEKSTKAKALNVALSQQAEGTYEVAVILDADNILAPDFLDRLNQSFDQGWLVVQGHRTAKNTNTSTAILDAISEEINNHILRKGHRVLGLSSALIGSGMAFEYGLFRSLMAQIHAVSGFDKELEMRLLKQRIQIEYLDDAICYDEKVQNPAVFEKQRTRWIAAQFKYLRLNFVSGWQELFRGNVDYFDKVFQALFPPRVMLLGGIVAGAFLLWIFLPGYSLTWFVTAQMVALFLAFFLATPPDMRSKLGWRELSLLPNLFIRIVRSLFKLDEAHKKFIHTPHGIEEDTTKK